MVSANRLLVFREGALCGSAPLSVMGDNKPGESTHDFKTNSLLRRIRLCPLSDDIRVAVVLTSGVTVMDVGHDDMQMQYRRVRLHTRACGLVMEGMDNAASAFPNVGSSPWVTRLDPQSKQKEANEVQEAVDAEFVAFSSLAILFSDEAVVVELGPAGHVVRWRIQGSYSKLAVCRTNMHLAFAIRFSTVEVFPLKVKACHEERHVVSPSNFVSGSDASVVFSPSQCQPSLGFKSPITDALALRGVSTKLGLHKILEIEWHRIVSQTVLCVTCQHPQDGRISIALFTVQSMPVVWPLQQRKDSNTDPMLYPQDTDPLIQLLPAGTVSLSALSSSPVATKIVPTLSRSRDIRSLSNKLEFLSLSTDGSIRTTCYRFGQQKQGGFPKQRTAGLVASQLLLPLQNDFGNIVHIDVLPIWKSRAVEFGTFTPQAEQLLSARRYRLLTHFANGMIAKVMVDLLTQTVNVESFLTLGVDKLPPRLSTCRGMENEILLLGLSQERVFVLERVIRDPEVTETTLLWMARIPPENVHLLQNLQKKCVTGTCTTRKDESKSPEEIVRQFMEVKCPEKVRMIPSLMKACHNDVGKLLTQLTVKYGPLEGPPAVNKSSPDYSDRESSGHVDSSTHEREAQGSVLPLTLWEAGLTVPQVRVTTEGICFSTLLSVFDTKKWWCVPNATLESFAAARDELLVSAARCPAMAPLQLITAEPDAQKKEEAEEEREWGRNYDNSNKKGSDTNDGNSDGYCFSCSYASGAEASCEWDGNTGRVTVRAPTLPNDPPFSLLPFEAFPNYRVLQLKAVQLVNSDIVVGVLGSTGGAEITTVLFLYGLSLLSDITQPPVFVLELEAYDVVSFVLSCDGDAYLLRRDQKSIEWRKRIATDGGSRYGWKECAPREDMSWCDGITSMTPLWTENKTCIICDNNTNNGKGGGRVYINGSWNNGCDNSVEMQLAKMLFISSDGAFIHTSNILKPVLQQASPFFKAENDNGAVYLEPYHPATVLLLFVMGRLRILDSVLEGVLKSSKTATTLTAFEGDVCIPAEVEPHILARELCRNPVSIHLCERPSVALEEMRVAACTAGWNTLPTPESLKQLLLRDEGSDGATLFGSYISLEVLDRILELLSSTQLPGLSSQDQSELLCLLSAIRTAKSSEASLDAAASRFVFTHKLHRLRLRLGLSETPGHDLPSNHGAFLWATLSDAQPQLLQTILDADGDKGVLPWTELETAGVPVWLNSLQSLRLLAERVARGQYQVTKDVRESALMYCIAGKVGLLAALCKAEQNTKLHAFFSRDFSEARNKAAASTNAFAAVSKNQVLYGAAFFVLAGDVRSAAQVILQRHGSVILALYVLRLACNDNKDDLLWFIGQRHREVEQCGSMGVWEEASLLWRCGCVREAMLLLLSSPSSSSQQLPQSTVDAADRLSLLRYARRRGRGDELTPLRELLLLLRMTRLSRGERIWVPVMICCREAEGLRAQLQRRQDGNKQMLGVTKPKTTRMEADYNTGTLTFRGFDSDDEDTNNNGNGRNNDDNNVGGEGEVSLVGGGGGSKVDESSTCALSKDVHEENKVDSLDPTTAVALELELQYTQRQIQRTVLGDISTDNQGNAFGINIDNKDQNNIGIGEIVACMSRMTSAVGRHAPLDVIQNHLACFFAAAVHYQDSSLYQKQEHEQVQEGQMDPTTDELLGVVSRLAIISTRLALTSVMLRNADYALANALLGYSSITDVLREQKKNSATVDSVVSYVRAVRTVQNRVQAMAAERLQEEEGVDHQSSLVNSFFDVKDESKGGTHAHLCSTAFLDRGYHNGLPLHPEVYEKQLRTLLLTWCAAFLQLCALNELRAEVDRLRSTLTRLVHVPSYAHLLLWLLSALLCRVTLGFNAAAEQLMQCVTTVRYLDDSLLTNPNGIFIEEELQLRRIAELLERNLLVGASRVVLDMLPQTSNISLDLCISHAEFFWQLPQTNTKLSADTDAAVLLLQDATNPHITAHILYGQLGDGAAITLRHMETAWLRRHHTHASYREILLDLALPTNWPKLSTTDRVVLQQVPHPICSVDYDRSSCDTLVWGTGSGAGVSHGYREILSGDNEAAMLLEQPDRNMATAAFSTSLRTDTDTVEGMTAEAAVLSAAMERAETTATNITTAVAGTPEEKRRTVQRHLQRRPHFSMAADAQIASHPHLPFFLASNRDGHVDLYSFNSSKCVATFTCGGSYAVTGIVYAPNGHLFAAGFADGGIAAWRFGLAATVNDPLFLQQVLPPGGVKAVLFCENQMSVLLVVGFDFAKAGNMEANGNVHKAKGIVRKSKGSNGGIFSFHSRRSSHSERPVVGVILLVDLVLQKGVVLRREIPFVPEYAVYLASLESLFCVAADGRSVLYDVWKSTAYILTPQIPASPRVEISCLAVSHYDALVALGTVDGHVLLLQFRTIQEAKAACVAVDEMSVVAGATVTSATFIAEENILVKTSRLQVAPVLNSHSGVRSLVFTPSVLLAGLADGKLVAATLVSRALRLGRSSPR